MLVSFPILNRKILSGGQTNKILRATKFPILNRKILSVPEAMDMASKSASFQSSIGRF